MAVGSSVATADGTEINEWRLILVLVLATAIGPFSMQVFLPALPAIQSSYGVTAATAQLAFSLSAFAMAVATLFYGPISDRVGRRRALLAGIVIFIAGSLVCAFATSITWLIIGRIVQAAGGVAGMVLGRAIVRDVYDRERSASAIAYITMAMVVAPMLAPAIGGVLTDLIGWTAVFLVGGGLGVLVLLAVHTGLPETLVPTQPADHRGGHARRFRSLAPRAGLRRLRRAGRLLDGRLLQLPGRGTLRHDHRARAPALGIRLDVHPDLAPRSWPATSSRRA